MAFSVPNRRSGASRVSQRCSAERCGDPGVIFELAGPSARERVTDRRSEAFPVVTAESSAEPHRSAPPHLHHSVTVGLRPAENTLITGSLSRFAALRSSLQLPRARSRTAHRSTALDASSPSSTCRRAAISGNIGITTSKKSHEAALPIADRGADIQHLRADTCGLTTPCSR